MPETSQPRFKLFHTIGRVARYTVVRSVTLFFAVVLGLYLTILVANFGGYVDRIFEGRINDTILGMIRGGWLKEIPEEQRETRIEEMRWQMEEEYGLHEPFLLRTWKWLVHGLTLDFGNSRINYISSYIYADDQESVGKLIKLALPYTLSLMGGANLLVFVLSLIIAMNISRHHGGFWDRLLVTLSPLSSIPPWVHGIWLIILFAGQLHLLPFPRQVEILGAENWKDYLPFLAQFMVLPFLAVFIGAFFQSIYFWRSYFLIYSGEDYVELARAKGLPDSVIKRTYILRPALPAVITSFALTMIGLWQNSIALEVLFYWQGIGQMFMRAVRFFDTPMIVGIVVCFAYLLAITVFILDIVYAVLDPRVRIDSGGQARRPARLNRASLAAWISRRKSISPQSLPGIPVSQMISGQKRRDSVADRKIHTSAWRTIWPILRDVLRNPSASAGLLMVAILMIVSIATVIFLPYEQTVAMWRREEKAFLENPRTVPPEWTNLFRRDKLPTTLILDSRSESAQKKLIPLSDGMSEIDITFTFHYDYHTFPQDLVLFMEPRYVEKPPLVDYTWVRPDGKEFRLGRFSVQSTNSAFYVSQDPKIRSKFGERPISDSLFLDPESESGLPLSGEYQLKIIAFTFEDISDFDVRMVLYGQVYGMAGTDHLRRDLLLALLWGTPVALAFGLLGALLTTFLSMLIAAMGVWMDGWVDELIQRISEVNLILPTLPIAIMVFVMYSKSIWAILGVVVVLSIFGNGVKIYRAAFLQIRASPYIEAAQAYGASNWRIILYYLTPRILPVLVPQLVIMVPGYVFFEATLAYLGVSDPYIPTWGKMIYEALSVSWFTANYYWIIQPVALLLFTSLAFAMLGFTLDRVLNPRLRE